MHNASINKEVTEATNPRGSPSHHDSDATIIKSYMACIKGFIDMVKGLLACSSESSSPSPSSYPTTSSNMGSIRRKRNDGKNKVIVKQKNQSAQNNVK